MKALLIIDIQNDFLPGGSLEVTDGQKVIPIINALAGKYDLAVATQDWHPWNHKSFASNHDDKEEFEIIKLNDQDQVLWPDHCVQGSEGADFSLDLNLNSVAAIFRKGMNPAIDSYSGFFDNDHKNATGLSYYLKGKGVTEVYLTGLAADFCVAFTAMDAVSEGFKTYIIERAIRTIDEENFVKIRKNLENSGIVFL